MLVTLGVKRVNKIYPDITNKCHHTTERVECKRDQHKCVQTALITNFI